MPAPFEDVAYGLGLADVDPASLNAALGSAAFRLAARPATTARALAELAREQSAVVLDTLRRLAADGYADEPAAPGDARFADRAWTENPFLRGVLESYLVTGAWAQRMLEEAELPEPTRGKARFALRLVLDALAPSNLPWLNPAVVKEAIDTGGRSLARGAANFLDDLVRHGGLPREVDEDAFELGRNLAATPGRIVFRNELVELIAYDAQTDTVHAEPVLYVPSWINKYYVLDLSPGRSFVEYAVGHGFTVFAVSWRNPDRSLAELTLDDYLREGLFTALDAVERLLEPPRVNLLGVCLGGTLSTIGLAVLAARGEADCIGTATFLNTLVDYSDPGEIGVFTDEAAIERIERRMRRRGYLSSSELAAPFTWMRANDLVWRYVVSSWYQGRPAPAFDLLAWNADGTRLPATMHAQFLRACYLRNALVEPGGLTVDGTPVDVGRIETPLYLLAGENDHIAPWRSNYRTAQLVGGEARFVLSSAGHAASMVNPPGNPKARYRHRPDAPADAERWLEGAELVSGSWWEDWVAWAAERSGPRITPPKLPDGESAPGRYARER